MKYKNIRLSKEAYIKLKQKKEKMEVELKKMTNKNIRIPMTKVMKFIIDKPVFIGDTELKKTFGGRKIRI